jgi:hypothetical protein
MLLSVEGPHTPDILDAREQQNAVSEQLVNEMYLCWQKKFTSSVNTEEIFADVTVIVRVKFSLKLPVVDMTNH